MWGKKWGWFESVAIVAGLGMVGVVLQLSVGAIPHNAFVSPVNIVGGSVLVAIIILCFTFLYKYNKKTPLAFFAGGKATLSSMAALLLVLVLMGFTKQIPISMGIELTHPIHRIGLSHILSTWYFLILYLYLLFVLGFVIINRVIRIKANLRDIAFVMNHIGLFITLFFGMLASADLQRYRMHTDTESDYPEWRGIDNITGQVVDLPIAIDLLSFDIDEYPPKLMIIDNNSGKPLPLQRAESLSLEAVPTEGMIDGWQIKVKEYLSYSAAVATPDSLVFREFRSLGAVHSAKVDVRLNEDSVLSGWVATGSHIFPYRSLKLTDSVSLVMADPEPKQYSSRVVLYAQNGDTDSATIKVNQPLRYKSWYIYQLNYNREQGRWSTMSEFELVKDNWLWGVYIGFAMLFVGAAMLFMSPLPKPDNEKELKNE